MSGSITARDRVWAAVVKAHNTRMDVDDVRRAIRQDLDDPDHDDDRVPNDETIKRVLRAATALDVLDHTPGSPYWTKREGLRSRWPVRV